MCLIIGQNNACGVNLCEGFLRLCGIGLVM